MFKIIKQPENEMAMLGLREKFNTMKILLHLTYPTPYDIDSSTPLSSLFNLLHASTDFELAFATTQITQAILTRLELEPAKAL